MDKAAFKNSVLHQLHALGLVDAKPMFGAYGLYFNGVFFGIIDDGAVYFKTDDTTRLTYEAYDMPPFEFGSPDKPSKTYYQVPPEIMQSPLEFAAWAREAVEVGKRTAKPKKSPKKKP